jgi:uncharacterized RDD family membrane protein YckC
MSRFKRVGKQDLVPSTRAPDVDGDVMADGDLLLVEPPKVVDHDRPGWWLPDDVDDWYAIPEPERGTAIKEAPLTVEQLMRREREFHLYGRGAGGVNLPDHFPRLIAAIVDLLLHAAIVVLGVRALHVAYPDVLPREQTIAAAAGAAWVLLTLIPLLLWRATPGKLLLGLRIVAANGAEASGPRAIGRGFAVATLVLLPLDILCILGTAHRRRLIDYVAGTRVVANS